MKEKDSKIVRYGTYITQLVSEVKSLKSKQKEESTAGANPAIPTNDVIVKLSKENEDLHTKVKKVSEEMKSGKAALRKVEENNSVLAKSIRDLQDKLNSEKNKSSKIEVEKKKLERNSDRLEEIIEITSEKQNAKERDTGTKIVEEKWCRFGKECHNLHPTLYCEWFQKVGKCPIDDCKDLHSKKDCPFWSRGFCKNDKCRMKHDPKLRGSPKRERSLSPNKSPANKRIRIVPSEDRKTDVYYNNTIEERFNKQAEQNHFLAKSLAGISAELKNLSSQQVAGSATRGPVQPPLRPQTPEQTWSHVVQTPQNMHAPYPLPGRQTAAPFPAQEQQHQVYHPYQ